MSNNVKISAIDFCVPQKVVTNDDLAKIVETNDEWISQRTGIKERRVVSGEENATMLGIKAAKKVIDKSGVNPLDIELIIVAASSPHRAYPSAACEIQAALGCKNAAAFDIKAACSGFIYGMSIAKAYINSGMYEKILLVSTDATSKFVDWSDRSTCVLFGDGAGAAVLERTDDNDDIEYIHLVADGDHKDLISLDMPNENCPLAEKNEQHPTHILMQGREVYKFVMQKIPAEVKYLLEKAGKTSNDIDYFIPHQANLRMIEALSERLHFPQGKVVTNIQKYGNISAASIPSAIREGIESGQITLPCKVLICAFGAGMTIGSAIITLRENLK